MFIWIEVGIIDYTGNIGGGEGLRVGRGVFSFGVLILRGLWYILVNFQDIVVNFEGVDSYVRIDVLYFFLFLVVIEVFEGWLVDCGLSV